MFEGDVLCGRVVYCVFGWLVFCVLGRCTVCYGGVLCVRAMYYMYVVGWMYCVVRMGNMW